MANTKYKLTDASKMLRSLETGNNTEYQIDANGDGKKSKSDVDTILKTIAGWDTESAMDPYKGKEITPSNYSDAQAYLLGKTVNREPFSFSGGGELWDAYSKAYQREGDKAMRDTMATAASMTGGTPSSYAISAASQAKNQYGAALTDKIPEIYNTELQKYYNDAAQTRQDLAALQSVKSQDLSEAQAKASLGDYTALKSLGVDTSQLAADRAYEERQRALNEALTAAQYGDYSKLSSLGIDTSQLAADRAYEERQRALSEALTAAQYGDYSKLSSLGIDTGYAASERDKATKVSDLEYAYQMYTATGDTSYLSSLGADVSRILTERAAADEASSLERAYTAAQIANLQNSGSGSSSTTGYTDDDESRLMYRFSLGSLYWNDEVRAYTEAKYGMTPEELWYLTNLNENEGYTRSDAIKESSLNYDDLVDALNLARVTGVTVLTDNEWNSSRPAVQRAKDTYNVSTYDQYLRAIANAYL